MELFPLIGTILAGATAVGTVFNFIRSAKADKAFALRMKEEIESIKKENRYKELQNKPRERVTAFISSNTSYIFITPTRGMEIAKKIDDEKLRCIVIDWMRNASVNSQINYLTSIVNQSGNTATVIVKEVSL